MKTIMRIRVLDPDPRKWHTLERVGRGYRVGKGKGTKFLILDVGRGRGIPGIQGLAFIRGVPRSRGLRVGDGIESRNWATQAVRIEYKAIGLTDRSSPERQIKAAKRKYLEDIKRFLSREHKFESLDIVPKGEDFQIDFL